AADGWRRGAVRQRRVGARLLPQLPEPARRLPQGVVERRQLEDGWRAVCSRQGRQARRLSFTPEVERRPQRLCWARWRVKASAVPATSFGVADCCGPEVFCLDCFPSRMEKRPGPLATSITKPP